MTSSLLAVRRIGLLAILAYCMAVSLAAGGASDESKRVAKFNNMSFGAHHLYPGGGVVLSVDALSLPGERIMALTFDDGPEEQDLGVAALLQRYNIPATFFFIGRKAETTPDIVQKIKATGQEIGYHSYRHQRLSWFSPTNLTEDFRRGKTIMDNLGVTLTWFRPPYGEFNAQVVKTAKEQGMETINWTIDSRDWTGVSAPTMARNVIRQFHPGAVLLFHSTHAATLQALPTVVEAAAQGNYHFVSLDEWRQTIQTANCRMQKQFCPVPTPVDVTTSDVVPASSNLIR
ncbi:MAG: polysaccharide deacetylase family protein [Magnetococcales bacterium]|nr:polysaccharide deacetylase family protein [Magnetococcales bacterium]